jgi:hypothetical protein
VNDSFSLTAVNPRVYRAGPPTTQAVAYVWNVRVPPASLARVVSRFGAPKYRTRW